MTLDLGRIHPLTGPVEIKGAEPGDILEVEILDVSPIVDFGYVTVSPLPTCSTRATTSPQGPGRT